MSTSDEVGEFVDKNSELLSRILACGSDEARAYALALLANSEDPDGVDEVQKQLDQIRRGMD